jgi:predicted amidohydrolase YtcJ
MSQPRADRVLIGPTVMAATSGGLETAEAIGIAGDRVVAIGRAQDVMDAAAAGAAVTDVRDGVLIPGLHDFHLHLAAMARARLELGLDEIATFDALIAAVRERTTRIANGDWLLGRGWHEEALDHARLDELETAVGERPASLTSHDGHSLWASAAARRVAGIDRHSDDPPGGRIERAYDGEPNGVLREAAQLPVDRVTPHLRGPQLEPALHAEIGELNAWGITSATDAGDPDTTGGAGRMAAMGASFSTLHDLAPSIAGRLRLTLNLPAEAIDAAAEMGLHSDHALDGGLRVGWAKVYGDGALGSRTAALFEPYSCGDALDTGILRYEPEQLAELVRRARAARIGLAIHAIGDRAVTVALDALAAGGRGAADGWLPDRIEHAQLVRPADRARFALQGVTASVQPIHAVADRDMVESCWQGRQENAYAFRSLLAAGARLAFGSDAPIESANPWSGFHAATRRHLGGDGRDPWRAGEAVSAHDALAAYTIGPAVAGATPDLGRLQVGAQADLAVLDVGLDELLAAGQTLAGVRARLTLIAGRFVHGG